MLRKSIAGIFCLILAFCLFSMPVDADTYTPLEDFIHTIQQEEKTIILTKYTADGSEVRVPESYRLDGVQYSVILDSSSVFFENTNLRSVAIESGVAFKDGSMSRLFANCTQLRSVNINAVDTGTITDMSYLFYNCEKLEALDLSGFETGSVTTMKAMFSDCVALRDLSGYRSWDTHSLSQINYMFNKTLSLKTVDIRKWDLSNIVNSGWCFQNCAAKTILLPDDLSVISAGFLNHATRYAESSFEIPVGVKKIGYAHTFYDFGASDFAEFTVDKGNSNYKVLDGILYSADGSQMLAIPRGKKFPDGVYEIPEGVTFLGELSFSRNYNVKKVILPDSYVLRYVDLCDQDYILFDDTGNLNSGINLNIAIYCYTGVSEYAVKPSNSHYAESEGVIYTKDMKALVAVPTRYSGKLQIPEGTLRWEKGAMWCAGELVDRLMSGCTGVVIPASMTEISPDQMDKLNHLKSYNSRFEIEVSADNPVYYVGRSGKLMQKPRIADMEIRLESDTVTYDGTEKRPQLILSHEGKILQEGRDYTVQYENNVNAGTGWIQITALGLHTGSTVCTFSIEPAIPSYIVPSNITAEYGKTLKDVLLPEGFSWMHPDEKLSQTGIKQFMAKYHTDDPNYADVEEIPVSVEVLPKVLKDPIIQMPAYNSWYGKPVTPQLRVMDGEIPVASEEYLPHFSRNNRFGIGKVDLKDVPGGNYEIEGDATFLIMPDPVFVIAAATLLWIATTGRKLKKTGGQSKKQQKSL